MDVLTEALEAMRTGASRAVRTDVRAPWGLRFPAVTGAGFHVVLQGACVLRATGGAPRALGTGDVVFLRDGAEHGLADAPDTPLADFVPARADPSSPVGTVRVDGTGDRAILLCGAYQLDRARAHPLLRELPAVVHLPARTAHSAGLGRLV
jgi:hypothetical protein